MSTAQRPPYVCLKPPWEGSFPPPPIQPAVTGLFHLPGETPGISPIVNGTFTLAPYAGGDLPPTLIVDENGVTVTAALKFNDPLALDAVTLGVTIAGHPNRVYTGRLGTATPGFIWHYSPGVLSLAGVGDVGAYASFDVLFPPVGG